MGGGCNAYQCRQQANLPDGQTGLTYAEKWRQSRRLLLVFDDETQDSDDVVELLSRADAELVCPDGDDWDEPGRCWTVRYPGPRSCLYQATAELDEQLREAGWSVSVGSPPYEPCTCDRPWQGDGAL